MNDENQFDSRLEELFAREHTHLPAEPFVPVALRALGAQRKRAVWTARLLKAAGVVALIALSPRLIDASVWLAMHLDTLAAWAVPRLSSPFVLAGAALCVLAAFATKWARVW